MCIDKVHIATIYRLKKYPNQVMTEAFFLFVLFSFGVGKVGGMSRTAFMMVEAPVMAASQGADLFAAI